MLSKRFNLSSKHFFYSYPVSCQQLSEKNRDIKLRRHLITRCSDKTNTIAFFSKLINHDESFGNKNIDHLLLFENKNHDDLAADYTDFHGLDPSV